MQLCFSQHHFRLVQWSKMQFSILWRDVIPKSPLNTLMLSSTCYTISTKEWTTVSNIHIIFIHFQGRKGRHNPGYTPPPHPRTTGSNKQTNGTYHSNTLLNWSNKKKHCRIWLEHYTRKQKSHHNSIWQSPPSYTDWTDNRVDCLPPDSTIYRQALILARAGRQIRKESTVP